MWPYVPPQALGTEIKKFVLSDLSGVYYDDRGGTHKTVDTIEQLWPTLESAEAARQRLAYPKDYKVMVVTITYQVGEPEPPREAQVAEIFG